MENLFKQETYEGAHITQPQLDQNTIIIDRVKGTSLRVVFKREVADFEVRVRISGKFMDLPEPNHLLFMTQAKPEDVKELWHWLEDHVYKDDTEGFEARCQRAYAIIETGKDPGMPGEKPRKRKGT